MSGTKRKEPPELKELCHDALAEGVLMKHDGLPESWLAMFKEHPAAWKQLQEAVLAPDGRYAYDGRGFTEESTVFVYWCTRPYNHEHRYHREIYSQFVAPATGLPKWLFILLAAYLELWGFYPEEDGSTHPVDAMGSYEFVFKHPEDVAEVWKGICERLPEDKDDCKAIKLLHNMFVALDAEAGVGLYVELESKLSVDVVEIALDLEGTIRSNRDAVADVITEALYNPTLLNANAVSKIEKAHEKANRVANYFRAPALSLHFDYERWNRARPPYN